MGLFSSKSSSKSTTNNTSAATQVEDGIGISLNSTGNASVNIETTDHGAIDAAELIATESIDAVRDVATDVTRNFTSSLSDLDESRSVESANNLKAVSELAKVVKTGVDSGGILLMLAAGIAGAFAIRKWT